VKLQQSETIPSCLNGPVKSVVELGPRLHNGEDVAFHLVGANLNGDQLDKTGLFWIRPGAEFFFVG
jgi:hypothetical protein